MGSKVAFPQLSLKMTASWLIPWSQPCRDPETESPSYHTPGFLIIWTFLFFYFINIVSNALVLFQLWFLSLFRSSLTAFYIYLFIYYFWLCWVFIAAHRLSLVAASRGYSSLRCTGFSLQWLLLLQSTGSRCAGFSSSGSRDAGRRLSSCGTWA